MSLGDLTCFYPFFLIQKTAKIMFCLTSTSSRDDENDLELRGQRVCVGRESRVTTNFIMIIATFFPPLSCSHYCFQALTSPKAGFSNGIYFLRLLISSAWRILACYDSWLLFPTWKNLTACRLKRRFLKLATASDLAAQYGGNQTMGARVPGLGYLFSSLLAICMVQTNYLL